MSSLTSDKISPFLLHFPLIILLMLNFFWVDIWQGRKQKPKDNLNRAKFVRDKDLIGTTHSSSFVTFGKVGSEPKPTFGILDHPAEFPPSLQHFLRRMFCLHPAKVLVQIRLHCLWAMILPLCSCWSVNFCKIRINTMNDLCVLFG